MIYKTFFSGTLFSLSVLAMEPAWQTLTTMQEVERFQSLIVVYRPRQKLGEQYANQLSDTANFGYVIPKFEQDTNLLVATLTNKPQFTRLINTKTFRIEQLSMRLADSHEIASIMQLMKNSDQLSFDYICCPGDYGDTICRLTRYNLNDIQKALENPPKERKNIRKNDAV